MHQKQQQLAQFQAISTQTIMASAATQQPTRTVTLADGKTVEIDLWTYLNNIFPKDAAGKVMYANMNMATLNHLMPALLILEDRFKNSSTPANDVYLKELAPVFAAANKFFSKLVSIVGGDNTPEWLDAVFNTRTYLSNDDASDGNYQMTLFGECGTTSTGRFYFPNLWQCINPSPDRVGSVTNLVMTFVSVINSVVDHAYDVGQRIGKDEVAFNVTYTDPMKIRKDGNPFVVKKPTQCDDFTQLIYGLYDTRDELANFTLQTCNEIKRRANQARMDAHTAKMNAQRAETLQTGTVQVSPATKVTKSAISAACKSRKQ